MKDETNTQLIPYPWQMEQWRRLLQQRQQDRLPHALLLFGQPGLGLKHFATCFAQSVFCQHTDAEGLACGGCTDCQRYSQGVHSDFMSVNTLEGKTHIVVDQIRELTEFLGLTSTAAGTKVIIISPADSMNLNAANSLLKTLEEPPGSTHILLLAHYLDRLPATVKSRCQVVGFARPDEEMGLQWLESRGHQQAARLLQLAQGAPCLAESFAQEDSYSHYQAVVEGILGLLAGKNTTFQLRHNWKGCGIDELVYWSLGMVRDCIRAVSGLPIAYFENSLYFNPLRNLVVLLDLSQLFRTHDHLVQLGEVLAHPLNKELLLDDVILAWQSLCSRDD